MNIARGSSRVSPRCGEELLAAGLSEPTWLSPWLLSADGETVPYLSRWHPNVVRGKFRPAVGGAEPWPRVQPGVLRGLRAAAGL